MATTKEDGKVVPIRATPSQRRARAQKPDALAKQGTALELRRAGASYEAIGQALGMTKQGAHQLVERAMAELAADIRSEAEVVREMELSRLDRLQLGLWPRAEQGDVRAAEAVLRIMTHRARLLGLDLPQAVGGDGSTYEVSVRYVETWRSD